MSIASTTHTTCRQPEGIDRLAQRLGLALVAWSERSLNRPELMNDELTDDEHRLQAQTVRAAGQLLSDRDDFRAMRQVRSF